MEKLKDFNVENQFYLYLKRVKLDPNKIPATQLKETKRAFFGAVGQFLLLLRDDLTGIPEEQAIEALDAMFSQVLDFWIREKNDKIIIKIVPDGKG